MLHVHLNFQDSGLLLSYPEVRVSPIETIILDYYLNYYKLSCLNMNNNEITHSTILQLDIDSG